MGKHLIIAEKPSVAKDIARALGAQSREIGQSTFESDQWIVSSAVGHLVGIDLPEELESKAWSLAHLPLIPDRFTLTAQPRTALRLKELRGLVARSDVETVINACDAGREGELIFGLIADYIGVRKPITRMWFQSMTPSALRDAYEHRKPARERAGLLEAARCRSESDLIVGANGTRALSVLREQQTGERGLTSAGRVQTPTLAMIVDRERAIREFVARDFWEVRGTFQTGLGQYTGVRHCKRGQEAETDDETRSRFWVQSEAQAVAERCRGRAVTSVVDDAKPSSVPPPKLFDLTSLQREANGKFGFTAAETLKLAQALYEQHKVLTYPRTDASALPDDYVDVARKTIETIAQNNTHAREALTLGLISASNRRVFDSSKVSDHFAIIPTGLAAAGLSKEESLLYELVVNRFLGAFFPDAQYLTTKRSTHLGEDVFESSGRVLTVAGWRAVYGATAAEEAEDKDVAPGLCALVAGELPTNAGIVVTAGKTKPPKRFTEATLLGAMEGAAKQLEDGEMREAMGEKGLGTPATRASIIEGLLNPKRSYIARVKRELHPTDKGMEVVSLLRTIGAESLTSPALTGEWEHRLDLIEKNRYDPKQFRAEIAEATKQMVEKIKAKAQVTPQREAARVGAPCPDCGGSLTVSGATVDCSSCGLKLWRTIAGRKLNDQELVDLLLHKQLSSRSGFVSSKTKRGFSAGLKLGEKGKVEFVFDDTRGEGGAGGDAPRRAAESVKPCPCGKGSLVLRSGRSGNFLGCNQYPRCKHTEQVA